MKMQSVISSNIKSIGYENCSLYIQFRNLTTYKYFNVSENIYYELMNATSHGKYFNHHIKAHYKYQKI
ncbi:MAG: KTSC domain-containing protein [Brevinema sp.]